MAGFEVALRTQTTLSCRLVVSSSSDLTSPSYGTAQTASDGILKLPSPTLSAGAYHWGVERNGFLLAEPRGKGKVAAATHKVAFSSCAETASEHAVFGQVQVYDPDCFFHLGDKFYTDDTSSDYLSHLANINVSMNSTAQAALYANVPLLYMPDDHDGGGNDYDGTDASAPASAEAWRKRFPHPTLELSGDTDGRYFSYDMGRVRYVFTDQRRYASPKGDTDNASKTVLGATQKTWFKDIIENSTGMYIVWICPRLFHTKTGNYSDSWVSFQTERTEICDHIETHASGRVLVVCGDAHQGGIDDGTNCDYATSGDPLRIIVASPLDKSPSTTDIGDFTSGRVRVRGVFGIMEVTDGGGDTIDIDLAIRDSTGTDQATDSFTVDLS